jgi:hypothetical protein
MEKKEQKKCFHKRIKRNYPFGRKSKPKMICKDCGKSITPTVLKETKQAMRRKR